MAILLCAVERTVVVADCGSLSWTALCLAMRANLGVSMSTAEEAPGTPRSARKEANPLRRNNDLWRVLRRIVSSIT